MWFLEGWGHSELPALKALQMVAGHLADELEIAHLNRNLEGSAEPGRSAGFQELSTCDA
jgi:hypothetical protein